MRTNRCHRIHWILLFTSALFLAPAVIFSQGMKGQSNIDQHAVEIAPPSSGEVARYVRKLEDEPTLTDAEKLALLREKIKYVFVLFQENRSFDFYFGTYPGARGLYSQSASMTPGLVQPLVDTNGEVVSISPFLIPQTVTRTSGQTVQLYPEDTDSVNHSHTAIDAKMDLDANHVARNDRYAVVEEGLTGSLSVDGRTYAGPVPALKRKQMGELVMAHIDCDTAPFMWEYADHFTLMDNFFETVIGPSTPNAIAMIAGQSGETQWVKHPQLATTVTPYERQLPMVDDPYPYWGSTLDILARGVKQPSARGGRPATNPASNLTFATLPLSFMGDQIQKTTAQDLNPEFDLQDVQADIEKIVGDRNKPVNWAWFQEGYDQEPTDPKGGATHIDYVAHHNAPQYFGYIANNPLESQKHLKGLADFYALIKANALPSGEGVFYVRGGFGNIDGLEPRSQSRAVQANFRGNDDHPGYSDLQISESQLADAVNAIAGSKYWSESAIIIAYDESDGLYDHAQPRIRSFDPYGKALDQGPRVPAIVISPYSRVHAISHEQSEHSSIIKFIDKLFNLTPLADLPDEASAREEGLKRYGQKDLGPGDSEGVPIGALFSAFDNGRLLGTVPAIPPQFAMIPRAQVTKLPHFDGQGCRVLQIKPTDIVNGKVIDPAPADFNPRPASNPGLPTSTVWPTN